MKFSTANKLINNNGLEYLLANFFFVFLITAIPVAIMIVLEKRLSV